ncbi:hypothetical protein [Streptomyces microflavus]|uniref:hypothetical protein n=1 Tax=Streptomyces microflavus TaxID=1919 RepID=UPI002E33625F|nr:hypothetical protein [Streptomyces microflavus]
MSDRDPDIGCAVLHKDSEGRTMPCPGDHPMPPPELSEVDQLRADNESLRYQIERTRWALGTDEPVNQQLRQAEIRAAVAEHEAVAYRNQVKALVRAIQRERGIPENELGAEVFVVASDAPAVEEGPACSDTPNCDGSCCKRAESRDSLRDLVRDAIGVEMDPLAEPKWADLLVTACRQLQASEKARDRLREQRWQLRVSLAEVLSEFRFDTHPGRRCKQTGHVEVARVERWQTVLSEVPTDD